MPYRVDISFGKDDAARYRSFLGMMNGLELINLSQEDIDQIYKDYMAEKKQVDSRITIDTWEKKNRFLLAMKTFFPDKEFRISPPDDAGS